MTVWENETLRRTNFIFYSLIISQHKSRLLYTSKWIAAGGGVLL